MKLKQLLEEIAYALKGMSKEYSWQNTGENEITITWRQD